MMFAAAPGDWTMTRYIEQQIAAIREKVGTGKVLCALSGGVDSSVVAALVSKAVGKQLTCVFVDTGLMRKNGGSRLRRHSQPDLTLILFVPMHRNVFLASWQGSPIQKQSVRRLVKNLSAYLRTKHGKSALWISLYRVRSIQMSLSLVWETVR